MNVVPQSLSSPNAARARPLLRIVIVGHVDHGKSTLIGRLLHETDSLPDGKLQTIAAVSSRRGKAFEWSFLLDALQTEREQGITLDTSQIRLRIPSRDIVLIDAPGHAEFLRNMITGAAQADAALLLIDAAEGVKDQTRRHGYLLNLLGITQVAVVINKMDLVGFDENRFHDIETEIVRYLSQFSVAPVAIIPVSARNGDGVARRTAALGWYGGPTVLDVLERFKTAQLPADLPLRMPVQAVYKFDDRRIVAGRIATGRIEVGDAIVLMPRGTTARVQSIEAWPMRSDAPAPQKARAGRSVGLLLDRAVFVDRGDLIAAAGAPANAVKRLRARIFWLDAEPLHVGATITVRIGMAERPGTVALIEDAVDPADISPIGSAVIGPNQVGEIEIAFAQPIAADVYAANPRTGRLVLDRAGKIAGGGLVLAIDSDGEQGADDGTATNGSADSDGKAGAGVLAAEASRLNSLLSALTAADRIARFRHEVAGKLVFTTGFGLEDQVILHFIVAHGLDIEIATLDTGRLFRETYDLWAETERRYGRRIRALYPQHDNLESLVARYGINGFYDSREARAACCHVRKVEPLDRALAGAAGWIVGLRAEQSSNRSGTALVAVDQRNLLKLSPLFDLSRDAVQAIAVAHEIPTNPLHSRWFLSIGCAPCTRAIAPGEPERAGRWWWETDENKECGLHLAADGRLTRAAGS
ncbi:MAG TPA: phosphoadenylyl-sulfate reductase [Xanthobacteraceae bacterium]|jgi:sulfate adenylyltransferase large subunit/phosphoadenylyl-sulfate reductase (thioredoxin)